MHQLCALIIKLGGACINCAAQSNTLIILGGRVITLSFYWTRRKGANPTGTAQLCGPIHQKRHFLCFLGLKGSSSEFVHV